MNIYVHLKQNKSLNILRFISLLLSGAEENKLNIIPEFQKQMTLCQRRIIVQQTTQRTATIYTQDNGAAGAYGPGWFSGGGQS